MRTILRHAIALLLFTFVCKIAYQAQENEPRDDVPKSLLLSSLSPQQAIPSGRFESRYEARR